MLTVGAVVVDTVPGSKTLERDGCPGAGLVDIEITGSGGGGLEGPGITKGGMKMAFGPVETIADRALDGVGSGVGADM